MQLLGLLVGRGMGTLVGEKTVLVGLADLGLRGVQRRVGRRTGRRTGRLDAVGGPAVGLCVGLLVHSIPVVRVAAVMSVQPGKQSVTPRGARHSPLTVLRVQPMNGQAAFVAFVVGARDRRAVGRTADGCLLRRQGTVDVTGIWHMELAPQMTPRVEEAALTCAIAVGHLVVPTGATQVRPWRLQPAGQVLLPAMELHGTLRVPLVEVRTVHILIAEQGIETEHVRPTDRVVVAGGGAQVTPFPAPALRMRFQPVGHLTILAVFPRQPPLTRSQNLGQRMTCLRPQTTPLDEVARLETLQPEGHLEIPNLARHPPLTRVNLFGHVSV